MSLLDLLRDIRDGEGGRPGTSLAVGEGGMLSFLAALTVLLFLSLAILLGNAVLIVNEKVEAQNAADAVALSSATQVARGLNAVAGVQHLMGELLALVVVHNAIGGDNMPESKQNTDPLRSALKTTGEALEKVSVPPVYAYKTVTEEVYAKGALLPSYKSLMEKLTLTYAVRAAGEALKLSVFPPTVAIGVALIAASAAVEAFIQLEWVALKALENFAILTAPVVRAAFEAGPPATDAVLQGLVQRTPGAIKETAEAVARMNRADGAIYPDRPRLPVARDPRADATSEAEMDKSQLVRASWPWVAYHRTLLFDLTGWMIFSGFKGHYREHTEKMMRKKSFEIYSQKKVYFLVLDGLAGPDDKGREVWMTSPAEAERRFAVLGFARRPAPAPWGGTLFAPAKARDLITYAQAIVYNANNQKPGAGGQHQPDVGWDTLNWQSPVGRHNAWEYPRPDGGSGLPQVRLNWQAKLIPVTRLRQAKPALPGPFRDLLRDLDDSSPIAKTH